MNVWLSYIVYYFVEKLRVCCWNPSHLTFLYIPRIFPPASNLVIFDVLIKHAHDVAVPALASYLARLSWQCNAGNILFEIQPGEQLQNCAIYVIPPFQPRNYCRIIITRNVLIAMMTLIGMHLFDGGDMGVLATLRRSRQLEIVPHAAVITQLDPEHARGDFIQFLHRRPRCSACVQAFGDGFFKI